MKTMNDFKTNEELLAEVLEEMTPLERATHKAMVSTYMLSHYGILQEVVEQIKEVELLKESSDLEERALLPLAEAGLVQLIRSLPTYGEC